MNSVTESKVLVIYTGGTIGMLSLVGGPRGGQGQGLAPEPFFLTETLRSQSRFHDPAEGSLFSHSSSVEGFRRWSTSAPARNNPTPLDSPGMPPPVTVPVRSSRPILVKQTAGLLPGHAEAFTLKKDSSVSSQPHYETNLPTLVTPRTEGPSGFPRRIRYAILEESGTHYWIAAIWALLVCLIHSTMLHRLYLVVDWIRIAGEVALNYHLFDAFVILHGTDTMCYTSSALSFLLEDLGKTVIITGAQIPLSQLRNDAFDNFLGALWIAGHYTIPECCLFFDHKLYRGNRASKTSSFDLNAFSSPNFPPLVKVGIDVDINWRLVWRQTGQKPFAVHTSMNPNVGRFVPFSAHTSLITQKATLRLFPGITAVTIQAFLAPPIQGVVLETFGAGNAPQREDLALALIDAYKRGVVIVAISQCLKGNVEDMFKYETGSALRAAGVIPGGDMTTECALAKLAYLLSKPEYTIDDVRRYLPIPLRGEITPSALPDDNYPGGDSRQGTRLLLDRLVRLSANKGDRLSMRGSIPTILVDEGKDKLPSPAAPPPVDNEAERILSRILVYHSVVQDDLESLKFALSASNSLERGREMANDEIDGHLINSVDPVSGKTPLHLAALRGSKACAALLLHHGALVHMRDDLDHTALYYALRQSHLDIAQLLVDSGAHLMGADLEPHLLAAL